MSLFDIAAKSYKWLPDDAAVESFKAWCSGLLKNAKFVFPFYLDDDFVGVVVAVPVSVETLFVDWLVLAPEVQGRGKRADVLIGYLYACMQKFPSIRYIAYERRGHKRRPVSIQALLSKLNRKG